MSAPDPTICFTLARAENGVIGKSGGLPWRLPDDFAHFKRITMGKPVIMGRTTLTKDLKKILPGRPNIVVTRDAEFTFEGAIVATSIEEALARAHAEAAKLGASEIHIIGGAEIFRQVLPLAERVYLTEVHGSPDGDVKLDPFDSTDWREVSRERHEQDARHEFPFSFVVLERR